MADRAFEYALGAQGAFLLIDKPAGCTSHDVIARLRRILGIRRIGHAGTLDPMATGLLVVAVGPCTRLLQFLSGADKAYEGTMRLGSISDTYDAEGTITRIEGIDLPDIEKLRSAAAGFVRAIQQTPPAFSAVKIGGRKAYELARRGEEVSLKSRGVTIYGFEIGAYNPPDASFFCHVSSGTYIRSLAHDLGQRLGCGAYLSRLRRIRVGQFHVGQATSLERVAEMGCGWLSPANAMGHLPQIQILSEAALFRLRNGQMIDAAETDVNENRIEGPAAVVDPRGDLAAIARLDDEGRLKAIVVLPGSK